MSGWLLSIRDLVDGLIIVAGSVDPDLEPNEVWFRAPLATPFLSWLLPKSFRASNEEIYQLKPELERMLPLWKEVKCPVIVIQGKRDDLVPAENADFAKKMLVNAPVELMLVEDMNHFVPWSHPYLIHDAILKMIEQLRDTKLPLHISMDPGSKIQLITSIQLLPCFLKLVSLHPHRPFFIISNQIRAINK